MRKLHTPCKKCVFAVYGLANEPEEGGLQLVQSGCMLGRVEAFRVQDPASVVEVEDETEGFYVIDGRLCNAYRSRDSKWSQEPGDPLERIRPEIRLQAALVLTGDASSTAADLSMTLESVRSLDPACPPRQVLVVLPRDCPVPTEAAKEKLADSGLSGRVVRVFDDSHPLDAASGHVTEPWFGAFNIGVVVPTTYLADIDEALNRRMERFSVLDPEGGEGFFCQTEFFKHDQIGGCHAVVTPAEETVSCPVRKARLFAEFAEKPWLVATLADIHGGRIF